MPVFGATPKRQTIVSTDRSTLPVSLNDLKLQAGIPTADTTKDSVLTTYIQAATELVGGQIGQDIFPTVRQDFYDFFPIEGMRFTKNPVITFTSIQYITDAVLTLLPATDYILDFKTRSHREFNVFPVSQWPNTDVETPDAVQIDYETGYADPTTVDPILSLAILQVATAIEANRGDCGSDAVKDTLINSTSTLRPAGLFGGRL